MAQTTIPDKSVETLTRGEGSADLGVTPGSRSGPETRRPRRHDDATERVRRLCVRGPLRRRRRDHGLSHPALHGDHDEPRAVHCRGFARRRVSPCRRRACSTKRGVGGGFLRSAGVYRLLRGRRLPTPSRSIHPRPARASRSRWPSPTAPWILRATSDRSTPTPSAPATWAGSWAGRRLPKRSSTSTCLVTRSVRIRGCCCPR